MRVTTIVGDTLDEGKSIGAVNYEEKQQTNFVYVFTSTSSQDVVPPEKQSYDDLILSHKSDALVLMNYNAGARIYEDIIQHQQYGIMTAS